MNVNTSPYRIFFLSSIIGLVIFMCSSHLGMFWDNVLFASKMGNHLYENGIFSWHIPDAYDPGHPPFLATILSLFWMLFGKSLWVSHFAMLPFVIGTIFQLYKFVSFYIKESVKAVLCLLFILADPTLSTALVLVNPEVIILFFFFLAVNGFLSKKPLIQFIGLFFLSIISFRSMMLFTGFFLFELCVRFYQEKNNRGKISFRFLFFYVLASLPGIVFIAWRLIVKGWLQTHPDSPWASLWHFPSLREFGKNCIVLMWRYADFGRVFILIFLVIGLVYLAKRKSIDVNIKQILSLSFFSVLAVILVSLFSTNAFGHRYFIVSYIGLTVVCFLILDKITFGRRTIFVLLCLGLLSGNLWIYPEKISQGWDATLAHIPYHELRKKAISYLDNEKIPMHEVGTFFPNYNSIDFIDLNGDLRKMNSFSEEDNYVFYSNVYNLSNDEYSTLKTQYLEVKRFEKMHIYVSILKRK